MRIAGRNFSWSFSLGPLPLIICAFSSFTFALGVFRVSEPFFAGACLCINVAYNKKRAPRWPQSLAQNKKLKKSRKVAQFGNPSRLPLLLGSHIKGKATVPDRLPRHSNYSNQPGYPGCPAAEEAIDCGRIFVYVGSISFY